MSRFPVKSAKKRSTRLSPEAPVGVKWTCRRGCRASQRRTAGVGSFWDP